METDVFRDDADRPGSPDLYWRRRMALLVGMLVVVAVVAWACSNTSGGSRPKIAAHPEATPTGPDPLAVLQSKPPRTASPTPVPTPSPEPTITAMPLPEAAPRRPGAPCSPSDLVLNLQGGQNVWAAGTRPTFTLTLVNTGHVMCKADVGPRALEIRITSGDDRIWSSSDCISGEAADIRRLERGIPYVRPIEWDRHRSARSCQEDRPDAQPGTYVVAVHADDLNSPKTVFHLR